MKTNFEKTFKESLDQHEFDYNPDAWKALESKLDQLQPTKSLRFKKGWYLVAAVAVVSVAVYYGTSDQPETNKTSNLTEQKQTDNDITIESPLTSDNAAESIDNSVNAEKPVQQSSIDNNDSNTSISENQSANTNTSNVDSEPINNGKDESETIEIAHIDDSQNINKPLPTAVVLPKLKSICQGESITIKNDNEVALVLHTPNESIEIKPQTTLKRIADIDGEYTLTAKNERSSFFVNPSPFVDFNISDDIYKNGVPTTQVECTVPFSSLQWVYENGSSTQRKAELHMFKKNVYPIKLEVKGANGCYGSITKKFEVNENFNLMATTSFRPYDNDPRVNTFLPYSLKQRNIPFHMVILDPSDGHVVYQTKDISSPWDGIDVTTGNMVPMGKNFIWKVTIEQNLQGESPEYAGTVVPVER